jgi:hypothetical protein
LQVFQHQPVEKRLGDIRYHSGFLGQVSTQCWTTKTSIVSN